MYVHDVIPARVGCVLSIMNLVSVLFPALSRSISVYIPSAVIAVPLM